MHNFSAESKKTESPIATQSFAARTWAYCAQSESPLISLFPIYFFVKNQYLNLKIAKEQNFKEF